GRSVAATAAGSAADVVGTPHAVRGRRLVRGLGPLHSDASVLDETNDVGDDERELRATAAAEPQDGATVTRAHPDHDDVHEWGALGVGAGWSCGLRRALGRSIEALDVDLLRGARVPRPGLAFRAVEPGQPV